MNTDLNLYSSSDHRPLDEMYHFKDPNSLLPGRPVSEPASGHPESGDLLRHLAGISQTCPEDDDLGFKLCFFSEGASDHSNNEFDACLRWGLGDVNGSPVISIVCRIFISLYVPMLFLSIYSFSIWGA